MRSCGGGAQRQGYAATLLAKIIASGWFDIQRIASELVTDERTVGSYVAGTEPMPLERQLCLARFLIERVPPLARQGHNLLGRVRAEAAFARSETVLHRSAPPPNARTF